MTTTAVGNSPMSVIIREDTGFFWMARVKGMSGDNITQSSVSSIALKVYDRNDSNTEVHSSALVVATVIFNTLQTDSRWTPDRTGYNFGATIPASAFPSGPRQYWAEVTITPVSGDVLILAADVSTLERIGG